ADGVAHAVDRLARGLALAGGQRAQRLQLRGDAAALAEQRDPQLLQRRRRVRGGDVGQRLSAQLLDSRHLVPRKQERGRTRALPLACTTSRAGRHRGPAGLAYAARAPFAFSASAAKPFSSCTAMSASTLRSRVMPALDRPFMKRL